MADELGGKAQQHGSQRTARHQLCGKDEEGHGHQRKAVDAREHFLEDDQLWIASAHEDRQGCRDGQRKRHRKAQREQGDDGNK
ncbi:hypothetical protein SDC9_147125 [bioreactor metagenome]|uniref:Uncharacterized protein n=1 Tax=bioreactor metagenome TaxID=1076179 RepID=A0A645EDH6_9ZZZZ